MTIPKTQKQILKEFMILPGVGKSIAMDFWDMGYRSLDEIKTKDPEYLYKQHCDYQKCIVDRCFLYVMRSSVYYLNNKVHDPEKLKWWNWTDERIGK